MRVKHSEDEDLDFMAEDEDSVNDNDSMDDEFFVGEPSFAPGQNTVEQTATDTSDLSGEQIGQPQPPDAPEMAEPLTVAEAPESSGLPVLMREGGSPGYAFPSKDGRQVMVRSEGQASSRMDCQTFMQRFAKLNGDPVTEEDFKDIPAFFWREDQKQQGMATGPGTSAGVGALSALLSAPFQVLASAYAAGKNTITTQSQNAVNAWRSHSLKKSDKAVAEIQSQIDDLFAGISRDPEVAGAIDRYAAAMEAGNTEEGAEIRDLFRQRYSPKDGDVCVQDSPVATNIDTLFASTAKLQNEMSRNFKLAKNAGDDTEQRHMLYENYLRKFKGCGADLIQDKDGNSFNERIREVIKAIIDSLSRLFGRSPGAAEDVSPSPR